MKQNVKTIKINGKVYNSETGELIKITSPQLDIIPINHKFQRTVKSSKTLNRDFVKKPKITKRTSHQIVKRVGLVNKSYNSNQAKTTTLRKHSLTSIQPIVISQSKRPDRVLTQQKQIKYQELITQARQATPSNNQLVSQIRRARTKQSLNHTKQFEQMTSGQKAITPSISNEQQAIINRQQKNINLTQAMAKSNSKNRKTPKFRQSFIKRHLALIASTMTVMILAGYLTYLNMPTLSIRIAAYQANINASYPGYKPTGYQKHGLANFNDGKVVIKYKNQDNKKLVLTEEPSNWSSKTVLENIVKQEAGTSYDINQNKGLTIYTYEGKAVWINGGILYKLAFDEPIPIEQINQIAVSF